MEDNLNVDHFPPLPAFPSSSRDSDNTWPPELYTVYNILRKKCEKADEVLSQEAEPFRLQRNIESLEVGISLLKTVEKEASAIRLPMDWVLDATRFIVSLIGSLMEAKATAREREDTNVTFMQPMRVDHRGNVGRPRKEIDVSFMREVASPTHQLNIGNISATIGVCRNTFKKRMREADIDYGYSNVSNDELITLAKRYRKEKTGSGIRYFTGRVRSLNLKVQQKRLRKCFKKSNRIANVLQKKPPIKRRPYEVSRPNALWHIDGHHKLILWGFVIHGAVDGHSRTITGLQCHTNNRAGTVLRLHKKAENQFGKPSRVRGDRGRENKAVAVYMIATRGLNRGSFIFGPSTWNTRIERIWVEVGGQFARQWRAFFFRLERLHGLNRNNPNHLWILHRLFLDDINKDCKQFQDDWNHHPISGEGGNRSPLDMRLMGQLVDGIYVAPEDNLAEEEVLQGYGAFGDDDAQIPPTHTGAGFREDEEPDDLENLTFEDIEEDDEYAEEDAEWENVDTGIEDKFVDAVEPPRAKNPFRGRHHLEEIFWECLDQTKAIGDLPEGLGVRREEWEGDGYPSFEYIKAGNVRKRGKTICVHLPDAIWRPRAEQWARALSVVEHILSED